MSGPVPIATLHCLGQIFTPSVYPHPAIETIQKVSAHDTPISPVNILINLKQFAIVIELELRKTSMCVLKSNSKIWTSLAIFDVINDWTISLSFFFLCPTHLHISFFFVPPLCSFYLWTTTEGDVLFLNVGIFFYHYSMMILILLSSWNSSITLLISKISVFVWGDHIMFPYSSILVSVFRIPYSNKGHVETRPYIYRIRTRPYIDVDYRQRKSEIVNIKYPFDWGAIF
ncbi:hypothetical protein GQR58_019690 [Nymphon striatum]|nr:hypothetical protein GQR58_019690 [Nymphon striatum]